MSAPRILFVGVATGGSLVHRVWPAWMRELGLGVTLEGVDLPPRAPAADYRALVQRIRDDPEILGAVITSHKLGVHAAAHDLLDAIDPHAELLGELNGLAAADGRLRGLARDPLAVERVLETMLPGAPSEVLCLGAGGAGSAIALSLLYARDGDRWRARAGAQAPRALTLVDVDGARLDELRAVLERLPETSAQLRFARHDDAAGNDALLAGLPDGALVVNATGLGKDAPGSPLTDAARFPRAATVWDANYRGELAFLAQARRVAHERELRVHDGWAYFLQGWAQTLAPILATEATDAFARRLADAARPWRPGTPGPQPDDAATDTTTRGDGRWT
jgi:shikimate 5-dehydrogenase